MDLEKRNKLINKLIELLKDKDRDTREAFAWALGELEEEKAIEPLCKVLLEDEDPIVRKRAAEILGEIRSPRAVKALIVALKDENPSVRKAAIEALAKIKDKRAIKPLSLLIKGEKNEEVKYKAEWALSRIYEYNPQNPLKALIEKLKSIIYSEKNG